MRGDEKKINVAGALIAMTMSSILLADSGNGSKDHKPSIAAGKGQCFGINACRGKGECGGPGLNGCAGSNECKGKGWLSMTEEDCNKKGGRFVPQES